MSTAALDAFAPATLGSMKLRNRVIKAATSEGRSPDGLVARMAADPTVRSRCTHNNKCMVTVFGRTHCVLDPEQRYGTPDALRASALSAQ